MLHDLIAHAKTHTHTEIDIYIYIYIYTYPHETAAALFEFGKFWFNMLG